MSSSESEGDAPAPPRAKAARRSPSSSPSQSTPALVPTAPAGVRMPPELELPAATGRAAPVLSSPPASPVRNALLQRTAQIEPDETYSKDEELLNLFLRKHPMLSLESTSAEVLQVVADLFERATVQAPDLPVVGFAHDSQFLRPHNTRIGERPCLNNDRCLAMFLAQLRYGPGSNYEFVCTEYLLPAQHEAFLAGRGLPAQRQKCLLCTRYYQTYTYLLARSDASFKIDSTPVGLQVFCNPCADPGPTRDEEDEDLREAAAELPLNASLFNCADGYKASAMLFADEEFLNNRSAREDGLGAFVFKPVVRFCSTHYRYVHDAQGLRMLQVGIGTDQADDELEALSFVPPLSPPAAAARASAQRP